MSEINQNLKKLLEKKSKNILTEKKYNDAVSAIRKLYPTSNFDEIVNKLDKFSELPSEISSALTINETFFFRHPEHFAEVIEYAKQSSKDCLKVFCGGVSSGEEAYSLAFSLMESDKKFEIQALDLSQDKINIAIEGKYHQSLIDRAPVNYRPVIDKYVKVASVSNKSELVVVDEVKKYVKFKAGNVFNFPLNKYDIIFFRNILIYFSDEDKQVVLEKLNNSLSEDGILFIGGGELFPSKFNNVYHNKTSIMKKVA
jgi:chemotaxis methyl-accepting protein methylase